MCAYCSSQDAILWYNETITEQYTSYYCIFNYFLSNSCLNKSATLIKNCPSLYTSTLGKKEIHYVDPK